VIELAVWGKTEISPKVSTVFLKGLIVLKDGLVTRKTPLGITLELCDSSASVYWQSVSIKPGTGMSNPGAPSEYLYSASNVGMFEKPPMH
jgi:hypothetical protein